MVRYKLEAFMVVVDVCIVSYSNCCFWGAIALSLKVRSLRVQFVAIVVEHVYGITEEVASRIAGLG